MFEGCKEEEGGRVLGKKSGIGVGVRLDCERMEGGVEW